MHLVHTLGDSRWAIHHLSIRYNVALLCIGDPNCCIIIVCRKSTLSYTAPAIASSHVTVLLVHHLCNCAYFELCNLQHASCFTRLFARTWLLRPTHEGLLLTLECRLTYMWGAWQGWEIIVLAIPYGLSMGPMQVCDHAPALATLSSFSAHWVLLVSCGADMCLGALTTCRSNTLKNNMWLVLAPTHANGDVWRLSAHVHELFVRVLYLYVCM